MMVILKTRPAPDQGHTGIRQKVDVQGIETIHLLTHIGQQPCRVDADLRHVNAVTVDLLHVIRHLRSVDEQFLGNTPPDHTGASHTITLDDRHTGPVTRCPLGRRQASGSCAEHNKIE